MKRTQTLILGFLSICITLGGLGYIAVKEDLLASLYKIVQVQESGSFVEKYDAIEHSKTSFSDRFYIEQHNEGLNFVFPNQNDKNNVNSNSKLWFTTQQVQAMMAGEIVSPTIEQSILLKQRQDEDYRFTVAQSTEPGKENEQMFYVNLNGTAYGVKSKNNESISAILEKKQYNSTSVWNDIVASNSGTTHNSGNSSGGNTGTSTAGASYSGSNTDIGRNYPGFDYGPGLDEELPRSDFQDQKAYEEYLSRRSFNLTITQREYLNMAGTLESGYGDCDTYHVNTSDCTDSKLVIDCRGSYSGVSDSMANIDYDNTIYSRDKQCNACDTNTSQYDQFPSGQLGDYTYGINGISDRLAYGGIGNNPDKSMCTVTKCVDGVIYPVEMACGDLYNIEDTSDVKIDSQALVTIDIDKIKNGEGYTKGLTTIYTPIHPGMTPLKGQVGYSECGSAPYQCDAGGEIVRENGTGYEASESAFLWSCRDPQLVRGRVLAPHARCAYPRIPGDGQLEGSSIAVEVQSKNASEASQPAPVGGGSGSCGASIGSCSGGGASVETRDKVHAWSCGTNVCYVEKSQEEIERDNSIDTSGTNSSGIDFEGKELMSTSIHGSNSCSTGEYCSLGGQTLVSCNHKNNVDYVVCAQDISPFATDSKENTEYQPSDASDNRNIKTKDAASANYAAPSGGAGGTCGRQVGLCSDERAASVENRPNAQVWSCGTDICYVENPYVDPKTNNTQPSSNTQNLDTSSAKKSTDTPQNCAWDRESPDWNECAGTQYPRNYICDGKITMSTVGNGRKNCDTPVDTQGRSTIDNSTYEETTFVTQSKDASNALHTPPPDAGAGTCGASAGACSGGSAGSVEDRPNALVWSCGSSVCYVGK